MDDYDPCNPPLSGYVLGHWEHREHDGWLGFDGGAYATLEEAKAARAHYENPEEWKIYSFQFVVPL